ncbi:MAG: carbohydrate porin [Anaerolineales bacterium]
MKKAWTWKILVIMALTAILFLPVFGQEGSNTKSGYEDVPQFGGPNSVGGILIEDDAVRKPWFRLESVDRVLQPWFDWKEGLNRDYGLSFGLDYSALGQIASDSLGKDNAAGGIFRFFGNWTVIGRESGNTGSIVFKVENRHRLGTDIAPQNLGFEVGYLGITGTAFSDYGWGLTNLYWKQRFNQGRISFVAGAVDVTDYLDVYGLINPWTSFQNLSFLTNPTIPAPNQGLGAAIGAMATDNIYVIGGLADTNGDPTEPLDWFDTFFSDNEYFYHFEVGWTSSQDRIYLDNIHLTGWYADNRVKAGVESGKGLAFSAAWFVNDTWMPFFRTGYSDGGGALLKATASAGIGYYFKESKDLFGFGLNWGRPPQSGLDDQYTAEIFYRFQLTQNLAITPDVQLIIDPALNPNESSIWIFGLRARLAL